MRAVFIDDESDATASDETVFHQEIIYSKKKLEALTNLVHSDATTEQINHKFDEEKKQKRRLTDSKDYSSKELSAVASVTVNRRR